jgi:hypothetical protein
MVFRGSSAVEVIDETRDDEVNDDFGTDVDFVAGSVAVP